MFKIVELVKMFKIVELVKMFEIVELVKYYYRCILAFKLASCDVSKREVYNKDSMTYTHVYILED